MLEVLPERIRDDDVLEDPEGAAADLAERLPDDMFEAALSFCCCPELAELTLLASPDLLAVPALVPAALPPPHAVEVLAILLILVDDAVLLGIDDDDFIGADSSP